MTNLTLEQEIKLLKSIVYRQGVLLASIVSEIVSQPHTGRRMSDKLVTELINIEKVVEQFKPEDYPDSIEERVKKIERWQDSHLNNSHFFDPLA